MELPLLSLGVGFFVLCGCRFTKLSEMFGSFSLELASESSDEVGSWS